MRLLILSETIYRQQRRAEGKYTPPYDIELTVTNLNDAPFFTSVFDYDVAIIHITNPSGGSRGYYDNIAKILRDTQLALVHGRSIICIPESTSFQPGDGRVIGPYLWLKELGVELQENIGHGITPVGAGRADVMLRYFKNVPAYWQRVSIPESEPRHRLAVVNDTQIVVGLEHEAGSGALVILPPTSLEPEKYTLSMMNLIDVARRYYERAQRHIFTGDAPDWLGRYLVPRAQELAGEISILEAEKELYDQLAYVLYGSGPELEDCVALLLRKFDLILDRQEPGANIDWKATHSSLNLGFGVEVTGTKGTIGKDSVKVAQAWQYISDVAGTPEEHNRLLVVANTELHLAPGERKRDSFSTDVENLLGKNGVLLITTFQLYNLWKSVNEGRKNAEEVVQELAAQSGVFKLT